MVCNIVLIRAPEGALIDSACLSIWPSEAFHFVLVTEVRAWILVHHTVLRSYSKYVLSMGWGGAVLRMPLVIANQ